MNSRSRGAMRPSFARNFLTLLIGGRREHRVRAAPAVSCAIVHKRNAHEHTGSAEAIRHSLRNGFNVYFVLSPVIGLFWHRHRRIWFCPPGRARKTSANLTPASEASGPHDFAVRVVAVRLRAGPIAHGKPALRSPQARGHSRVHRIPPRVCDDHDTPLSRGGMANHIA